MPTIPEIKEQEVTDTPLLLFECTPNSGPAEFWSTHAVTVDGHFYKPRVLRHNLFDIRSASEEGIDTVSKVSVTMANADSYFSQIERNAGWKGAKLSARFLFFDLATGEATSESVVIFRGVANSPDEITESTLRLTFANRLSLQRILLPEARIQRRCPWSFPATPAQRIEAVDGGSKGKYSRFYRCGYSADMSGGSGNLNGSAVFTTCDFTREQCVERGMFDTDSTSQATRRFGGVEFVPSSVLVRSYGEKGTHLSPVIDNEARYNDFAPLVYGTAWYQPPVVFARNDGNLTHFEVLLGMGEIQRVVKIIVNDIEMPEGQAGANLTATGWYNVIGFGTRTGAFNQDFLDGSGNPVGDPYGSMATLSVVVPNRINDGRTLPRIKALIEGLRVPMYTEEGVLQGELFTANPAWVALDILRRSGWSLDELDIGSFARTAAFCDELVDGQDLHGNPISLPRFQCNLVLQKRRSAADVLRGVRNGSALLLTYAADGKLQLRADSTIAEQQPSKPAGSNSTQTLNGGWPAYEFGDGTFGFSGILCKGNGEPSIRLWSRGTADTPNRYSIEFQDSWNEYQQDSLSLLDIDDVERVGQEVTAALAALGIPSFAQAARIMRLQLDKSIRGNVYVQFETTVRGLGLAPGDIITVTYLREGLQRQPFRVTKISPGLNCRTFQITAQIHNDEWYIDQVDGVAGGRRQPRYEVGLPRPLIGNILDENGDPQFEIVETITEGIDGGARVALTAGFSAPARIGGTSVGIPLLALTPVIATTGGTLAGGRTLYYAISAVDGNGVESALSFVIPAVIPATTNTNQVTLKSFSFSSGTAAFRVYRGATPTQLLRIDSDVAVGVEYVDTGQTAQLTGPPDESYDHANFYWRLEMQPPLPATIHTATTIGNSLLSMLVNENRGMTARITAGRGAGQERTIVSNTGTTLVVAPKWDVTPDGTSSFLVAEAGWHFGATGAASPLEFEVPNRPDATVHVSGRSANSHDKECAFELCPVTRWRIGSTSGGVIDVDPPPAPSFAIALAGRGTISLTGIAFEELTNTRTVAAATFTAAYFDELTSPTPYSLSASVGTTDTTVTLTPAGAAITGDLIQIASEVMKVTDVLDSGATYTVVRESHGSTAATHAAAESIYHLRRKTYVAPFPKDFFGSPASGSYAFSIFLPEARIAAAEIFVTNSRGSSETTRASFTGTTDKGLRTLSGGQFSIQVEGPLAIQTDAAPPLIIEDPHAVRDIFATVGEAATGSAIELRIKKDGVEYCTLTIPSGETTSNVVNGFGLPPLGSQSEMGLDITLAGQATGSTSGRDLTVTIRL